MFLCLCCEVSWDVNVLWECGWICCVYVFVFGMVGCVVVVFVCLSVSVLVCVCVSLCFVFYVCV